MKIRNPVLIEAHRGNSVNAPENTLEAIEQALLIGVDRVEVDLEMSLDGHLVIIHDKTLERTTNGSGLVADKEWHELKKLDAGSWKDPRYRNAKIPLLEEVFDLCRNRTMVNIDLKNAGAAESMAILIKKFGMEDQVVITGLIPECTERIRSTGLNLTMFYEGTTSFSELLMSKEYNCCMELAVKETRAYRLPGMLFTADWVNADLTYKARQHGLSVCVYDVNTPETAEQMIKANVNSVMTDDPKMVLEVIRKTCGIGT